MIAGMTRTQAIVDSEIEFTGVDIAFDLYHGGYHATDIANLAANLTAAGNNVHYINQTWYLNQSWDVLFLTEADAGENWTVAQVDEIATWMAQGNKLLWGAGDSDYAGLFDPTKINDVLDAVGAITRLDGTSISDPVFNDGASYRAAAPYFGVDDPLYDTDPVTNASKDCTAGCIYHGPCSILVYDGYYYKDLRYGASIFPERVWTIMTYSENATADDTDVSDDLAGLDLYANDSLSEGYYPAMTYEYLKKTDSHVILTGEAIYSDYKYMYDQKTENGVYNGGVQFGQVIVNNILNWLLPFPEPEPPEETSAFLLIPMAVIGVVYVLMKRK